MDELLHLVYAFKLIQVMLVALLTSAFLGAGGVLAGKYAKNRFNALEDLCLTLFLAVQDSSIGDVVSQ